MYSSASEPQEIQQVAVTDGLQGWEDAGLVVWSLAMLVFAVSGLAMVYFHELRAIPTAIISGTLSILLMAAGSILSWYKSLVRSA